MKVIVTGSAGFIGYHVARRLLQAGHEVTGIDGMTPYYDVRLKHARHELLAVFANFSPHIIMLEDMSALTDVFMEGRPDVVIHLAAQAGVRYSIEQPRAYVDSNLIGMFNVMESVRLAGAAHFLVASTSSVYGANASIPFRETDRAVHPLTLYAATKLAAENMTHSYSHLWRIPTTIFRFFTVYGPWGRPDMALFKFVEAINAGRPIDVYNHGVMERDFTYIDDLVESILALISRPPSPEMRYDDDSLSPVAPWRVVNIGNGQPIKLLDFISKIEDVMKKPAILNMLPMQPGDVPRTFAETSLLHHITGYRPSTALSFGVEAFCQWYGSRY
jgi:UDP-glucuronate 4-epimerase